MKRKMNEVIGVLKHGDLGKLAEAAKMNSSALTLVLNGKSNIENYPALVPVLKDYITKRKIELQSEFELTEHSKTLYKELSLTPPTDEELLKKSITRGRLMSIVDHEQYNKLLNLNEKLSLRIGTTHNENWSHRDWESFASAIADKLGLKERRR